MKKIKIIAVALLCALSVSLCTACTGGTSYIISANGEKQKIGPYLFYIQWLRDYHEDIITSSGYTWTTALDGYYTEKQTLRDYLISNAKSQYLSYFVVTQKFEELGLTLSEKDQETIRSTYEDQWIKEYGKDGMKRILKTLKLTEEEFKQILSVQSKSIAIIEHYYGAGGELEITEKDKEDYFNESYLRFKYILLSKTDDDNQNLPEEEIAHKKELAAEILQKLENGESIETLIPEYSEDYAEINDDMSESEKESAEKQNKQAIEDGLIIDKDGIFNQTLYTYYDIAVNNTIVSKLFDMQNGENALIEIDNSLWIVQKCDIHEKEEYYTNKAEEVYQELYGDDFSKKYTSWLANLNYTFNEKAVEAYKPDNLTPLFSTATSEDPDDINS